MHDLDIIIVDRDGEAIAEEIRQRIDREVTVVDPSVRDHTIDRPSVLITFNPPVWARQASNIVWIQSSGIGVDKILPNLPAGVQHVTKSPGRIANRMAEYGLTYCLAYFQKLGLRRTHQAERVWLPDEADGETIAGKTCLLVGTGDVGAAVATMLKAAGMIPIGCSRSGGARDPFQHVHTMEGLLSAHPHFDVVIAALPNTGRTARLIDAAFFERVNCGLFINVGRGAVLDTDGLVSALATGHVNHAVLDVFEEEPLDPTSPLWAHEGITITPHVSGRTAASEVADDFVENWKRLQAGEPMRHRVDLTLGY